MAKFFIERPIFAIVLSIIITLIGLISAVNLPIARYPQITPPQVNVSTTYSAANAKVVEQTVAQLIEQQVNGVQNMVSMLSTSANDGTYNLNVKFELGQDPDIATVQTQNRASQANASLPTAVTQEGLTIRKVSPATAYVFSLWSPNGTYDGTFLKNYGDINLVDALRRVPGVGNVVESGSDFAMRIWLQPDKMAHLGITTAAIANAITEQNAQAPAGTIGGEPSPSDQESQISAIVQGRLLNPEEFSNIIIEANTDGSLIRIRDVGRVELGAKNYTSNSNINGQPAATFRIQLTTDANALETIAKCQKIIEESSKKFPNDMQYKVIVDFNEFVKESMKEVIITLVESLLLVMIVVFMFLQTWRATLIPMLAVPVSLVGTLGSFYILGFSINILTMFAMVLAIGLVVDDAIVVIEAVEHHLRYNALTPKEATIKAMSEVSGPVVAIAFVLASVFIPVAFFGGTSGILYRQFALTIAVSMGLSAIVALSLTPALCVLLLKPHDQNAHTGKLGLWFEKFNTWFDKLIEKYGQGLNKVTKKTRRCMVLLAVLVILSGALFHMVPSSFVPSEDQGFFTIAVTLPEATNMKRTRAVADKVADEVKSIPGVQDVLVINGTDFISGASKPNTALLYTRLKSWDERETPDLQVSQIIQQVAAKSRDIPEANIQSFNAPSLPGIGSRGGFTLMLEDTESSSDDELNQISQKFIAAAKKRPEIGNVNSTFRIDTPFYKYEVDREKAKTLKVSLTDIYNALKVFLGGYQVNDFNDFGRTFKVIMQAEAQFRNNAEDIRFFYVESSDGVMVPLNTLVKPTFTSGPAVIQRFNGYRAIQLSGNPAPSYSSGQAMQALEEVAAQTLPAQFSYEWSDQSREEKISGGKAPVLFAFSLLFVFLCLAALYESWSIPFVIILCVPIGIFGAFLSQYLRHIENDIYMQIGLIMLIGLAAKNAILIVEFAKLRVDNGMNPLQAVIEAAKIRLRPILMTSLAFIIGCIPLALATGAGAGARVSMGTAVVGGMFAATSLGVFLIPVLFIVIDRISKKLKVNVINKLKKIFTSH
ncbi:MAG: bepE 2 [Firmicutes bacterium]|nr:bepE 2 [Bacillota bacterium]